MPCHAVLRCSCVWAKISARVSNQNAACSSKGGFPRFAFMSLSCFWPRFQTNHLLDGSALFSVYCTVSSDFLPVQARSSRHQTDGPAMFFSRLRSTTSVSLSAAPSRTAHPCLRLQLPCLFVCGQVSTH
ncbi:hypothetical protein HDV64DRAFT_122975 [Trichoderma sp. TUCIM 5745]